jgi:hypothetical protein
MAETQIHSAFVAKTAEFDYPDAVAALENLVGREIWSGSARLTIGERGADGLAGAASFSGRLRTGSLLFPSLRVDVVVSPWSATRVEFGIRPLGRVGRLGSFRLGRFSGAAWPMVEALIDRVGESLSPPARPAVTLVPIAV